MDAFNLAGLVLLAVSLALVVFVAATEAGLISISRARVRLMVGQGVPRAELLHSYMQERESLLHALALARNLAIVAAVALANKTARIVWAMLVHDRQFRQDYTTEAAAA